MHLYFPAIGFPVLTLPRLSASRPPVLRPLLKAYRVPDSGSKPLGLRVSDCSWRRNSALIMSLYEQERH